MECRGVVHVDFSPQERYVFTRNNIDKTMDLWDVASGKRVKTFPTAPDMFVFDASEHFCVRRADPATKEGSEGAIEVYNVMKDKISYIKAPGVTLMAVSPRDPYVATYTPDQGNNQGASIRIIDISNGKVLRTHTMYNKCISCKFYWHPDGHFLAAQEDTYAKGKRRVSCLILFRMDERGLPTQVIDEQSQHITAFAWEPGYGTRFAYATTDLAETSAAYRKKGNVSVYDMRCYGSKAIRLQYLEKKPTWNLSWSPQHGILLMSDLTPPQGPIEFYDVASNTVLSDSQHFNTAASNVQWDPSGRFVTLVSPGTGSGDAGYDIYTFTGTNVKHETDQSFSQFLWRPRPSEGLDAKRLQSLRESLPKFREEFQREEKQESDKFAEDAAKKLKAESDKFQDLMKGLLAEYDKNAESIRKLYNGYDGRDPSRFIVEQTVSEKPVA